MSITTYDALINWPDTHKISLCEITLGEHIQEIWAQESAPNDAVFALNYLNDTFGRSGEALSLIVKIIERVRADSVVLSVQATVADVQVTLNSFWHDVAGKKIYLNVGGNPGLVAALVFYFVFGFASEGITLNGRYYDPYLEGVPGMNQATQSLSGGYSQINSGAITLNAADGFVGWLYERFIWENRTVRILFGGEDLPYSEYQVIFAGIAKGKSWARAGVSVSVKSDLARLLKKIPDADYTLAQFPNLNQNFEGAAVRIGYGRFDERRAPDVVPVDEWFATDQVQFNICGHAIEGVDGVWFSNTGGDWWLPLALGDPGSVVNEYSVDPANGNIVVRFAANAYEPGSTRVKVAFRGRVDGSGNLIELGADIVRDVLLNYNGFDVALLDTASFDASADISLSNGPQSKYITAETDSKAFIDQVALGDGAFFGNNQVGLFVYMVWDPVLPEGLLSLDDSDLDELSVKENSAQIVSKVKVGFAQEPGGHYLYASDLSVAGALMEVEVTRILNTCLINRTEAAILAVRTAVLHGSAVTDITIKTSWKTSLLNIGSVFKLTTNLAPGGGFVDRFFEVKSISKGFGSTTLRANSMAGMLDAACFLADDIAPDYDGASEEDKQKYGYLAGDDDLIVADDPATRNRKAYL